LFFNACGAFLGVFTSCYVLCFKALIFPYFIFLANMVFLVAPLFDIRLL